MNYKKVFGFGLMFIIMISMAFADLTTNGQVGFSLDDADNTGSNPDDITGSGNDGTNTNAGTGYPGILNEAFNFTQGSSSVVDTPYNANSDFTVSVWFNTSATGIYSAITGAESGTTNGWKLIFYNDNTLRLSVSNGARTTYTMGVAGEFNDGDWHNAFIRFDDGPDRWEVWIDGHIELNMTNTMTAPTNNIDIGHGNANYYTGAIDMFLVYNDLKPVSDVNVSYNGGAAYNPYAVITPTIQTNLTNGAYYDHDNISVSVNTTSLVNMSYSINNNAFTSICNNCNDTNLYINFSEGQNNVSFKSIDVNGQAHNNLTIYIDTINPSLTVTNDTSYSSYTIDFSSIVSCSDTNLDYCNITIDNGDVISYTNNSYTFTYNGNHTFNVTAVDLAGNTNSSTGNLLLINPEQQIWFYDIEGSAYITNFTINGSSYTNRFNFSVFDYDYGTHSFLFASPGFETGTFSVALSNTSDINTTINIQQARFLIYLYDADTNSLITGSNFSLVLEGILGYNFTTSTSFFNISNAIALGEYLGIISSDDYETEEIYFTFEGNATQSINAYLIPSNYTNLGFITIQAYQSDNTPYQYIQAYAKEWFASSSAFLKVEETQTGGDGQAEIKVILEDRIYLFCIYTDNEGETCTKDSERITVTENGKTIPITVEQRITTQDSFADLLTFTENITVYTSNTTGFRNLYVKFDWVDLSGFNLEMCYNIYKDYSYTQTLEDSGCITGSAGTYEQIYLLNSSFGYIVDIDAEIDNRLENMYYKVFPSADDSGNINNVLTSKGWASLGLILYLIIYMTVIALLKEPFKGVVVTFFALFGVNFIFNSLMSAYALSGLLVFSGLTAWGLRPIK